MPKRKRAARKPNQSVERSKLDKYLTLDWKEFYLLLIAWFLFVVLHFMIGVIFKINEEILPFLYISIAAATLRFLFFSSIFNIWIEINVHVTFFI